MWLKIGIVTLNFILLGLFGWGTYIQINNQRMTNEVMAKVHENIQQARQLTFVTNQQLKPLRQTVATIEQMNHRLADTRKRLGNMNRSLYSVTVSEQNIVMGLDKLNSSTSMVLNQLIPMSASNQQLVSISSSVHSQTNAENGYLKDLFRLTKISIEELTKLNQKLKWLSYLP